jgi:hypothetical protein
MKYITISFILTLNTIAYSEDYHPVVVSPTKEEISSVTGKKESTLNLDPNKSYRPLDDNGKPVADYYKGATVVPPTQDRQRTTQYYPGSSDGLVH